MKPFYKIGDRVIYAAFNGTVRTSNIANIEIPASRENISRQVKRIARDKISQCTFTMEDGFWCNGDAILGE